MNNILSSIQNIYLHLCRISNIACVSVHCRFRFHWSHSKMLKSSSQDIGFCHFVHEIRTCIEITARIFSHISCIDGITCSIQGTSILRRCCGIQDFPDNLCLKKNQTCYHNDKWAGAWEFQQFDILTNVDSHEPVQPPFKLRNLKWDSVSSSTVIEYLSRQQRIWSVCAYAQAGLSLCWSHIPKLLEISCHGSNERESTKKSFETFH